MTDQPDTPDETAAKPSPPETATAKALPPAVWVTGVIILVLLLLAIFALG